MAATVFEKRLKWLGEGFEELHRVDPELIEELGRETMPTRLFRRGAGVEADIVMENVVQALGKGLAKDHPELPKLLQRLRKNFEIVARGADKGGLAYKQVLAAQSEWKALRGVVKESKIEGAQEVVRWLDRETDELAGI